MNRVSMKYGKAKLHIEYKDGLVVVEVAGEKSWRMGLRGKVPPLKGTFTFQPEEFLRLLEGVWGIEPVGVESKEGVQMKVAYDWKGWERGDDILKVWVTDFKNERMSMFYMMRFYLLAFSAFLLYLKRQIKTYAFNHLDISFIRDEGELIITKGGEEIARFSPVEACGLKSIVETHIYTGLPISLKFGDVDLLTLPKTTRWVFTTNPVKKSVLKLYMSLV